MLYRVKQSDDVDAEMQRSRVTRFGALVKDICRVSVVVGRLNLICPAAPSILDLI